MSWADAAGAQCPDHPDRAAIAACARCGRFFCGGCAGAAPEPPYCAPCDARVGHIAWEHDRARDGALLAWLRTFDRALRSPDAAARRAPLEGPIRPALSYAAIAVGMLVLLRVPVTFALEYTIGRTTLGRFGADSDALPGLLAYRAALLELVTWPVIALLVLGVGPIILSALAHLAGARVPARESFRTLAYASGVAVLGWVPLLAWIALPMAPVFVARALTHRAGLSTARATAVVAVTSVLLAGGSVIVAIAIEHALGPAAAGLARALSQM